MQVIDRHAQCVETIGRIQETINSLHDKLVAMIKEEENNKLKEYKNQLLNKKTNFEKINLGRSENAITQNILARRKALEKECALSLEKSMEASRMYELLKQKLNSMDAEEREMQLEAKFLQKKIIRALKKNQQLNEYLDKIKENADMQRKSTAQKHSLKPPQVVLGEVSSNVPVLQKPNLENSRKTSQKGKPLQTEAERRLRLRIDCTKDYIESLVFGKSDIERIFEPFLVGKNLQISQKDKIQLGEQILSNVEVKKQLYRLLFENNN